MIGLDSEAKEMQPYVRFRDIHDLSINPIKIANIQIGTPQNELIGSPPVIDERCELSQERKITFFLNKACNEGANLIILPELSTSHNICRMISEKFRDSKRIIVMGSYYDNNSHNVSEILVGKKIYRQFKINPSFKEFEYMKPQNEINVFLDSPIGNFVVLICYDATDFNILSSIKDFTDFIVCIARNEDVGLFDHMFRALTYLKYQYIIFSNDSFFGGSSIYAPFHINRRLDTLGLQNEGIIYRTIDLKELDDIRNIPREDNIYKYPPPSVKPRSNYIATNENEKLFRFKSQTSNYLVGGIRYYGIIPELLSSINNSKSLHCSYYPNRFHSVIECLKVPPFDYSPNLNKHVLKYFISEIIKQEKFKEGKEFNDALLLSSLQNISKNDSSCFLLFKIDLDKIIEILKSDTDLIRELLESDNSTKLKGDL